MLIRETLAGRDRCGCATVEGREKLVDEANSGLDEAEAALGGSGGERLSVMRLRRISPRSP